jgi:hypothetical protein
MERKDLYSYLVKVGYKLPKDWFPIAGERLRKDIINHCQQHEVDINELYEIMAGYNDGRFAKVMFRMIKNNHIDL